MIRKIGIDQLKPKMVIQSFVGEWAKETSDHFNKPIDSQTEIQRLKSLGIKEVFIQVDAGRQSSPKQTKEEVEATLQAQLLALGDDDEGDGSDAFSSSEEQYTKEVAKAFDIQTQANNVASKLFDSVQNGDRIDRAAVKDSVQHMLDSVLREEQAMMALTLLRNKGDQTFMHSVNVSAFLMIFCKSLGYKENDLIEIGMAGMFHDLGMGKIPRDILSQPRKLREDETQFVRSHVDLTLEILFNMGNVSEKILRIVGQHHERPNGLGYPNKLADDAISQDGHAVAIVDAFEAITAPRAHRKAMSANSALRKLMAIGKDQFNVPLLQKFVKCVGVYPIGTMVRLKNNMLAMVISNNQHTLLYPIVRVIVDKNGEQIPYGKWLNLYEVRDRPDYVIVKHAFSETDKVDPAKYIPGMPNA